MFRWLAGVVVLAATLALLGLAIVAAHDLLGQAVAQ